jgi:alpha-N-arabinofuranosidase
VFYDSHNIADEKVPNLSVSASLKNEGLNLSIVNPSISEALPVEIILEGMEPKAFEAQILSAAYNSYNDFENTENVKLNSFNEVTLNGNKVKLSLPACSVVSLKLS